jgi:DNA-binding NarL/FixJ family response regulator
MKQRKLTVQIILIAFSPCSCFPLLTVPNSLSGCRSETFLRFSPKEELPFEGDLNDSDGVSLHLTSHQSSISPNKVSKDLSQQKLSSTRHYDLDSQRETLVVWIIDDEKPILDAVGSYLQSSGYQVIPFLNATVPLNRLQDNQLPDAIICDVMMPQLSGIEFLSMIRSSNSFEILNIPFILLTAKGLTEDRIRGYDAGTDGYLMKPFDPEELVVMLDRLLQRKTFMQEGDDSVTIEELREDLSEVKELLTREERLLQDNKFSSSHSAAEDSLLSDDEILILELLCEGYMNKEIASELQYSTRWVEQHLTSMFRKSNCGTRTELVRWAVANEYVDI